MNEKVFEFGGKTYFVKYRLVLSGMDYYWVLENSSGERVMLYCFPEG